jgi:hypothetical protein
MLKTEKIDNDKAPFAYAAALDARMRNAVGITHFSPKEQTKTNAMMYALQLCYRAKEFRINWRDGGKAQRPKFASIKLEDPTVADRKMLNSLEDGWKIDPALKKIVKKKSAQGILYRAYF